MLKFATLEAGDYVIKPDLWYQSRCANNPEYPALDDPVVVSLARTIHIGLFPVTNIEFEEVIPRHQRSMYGADDDHPVVSVTYYEVLKFCREKGVRLPANEEWLAAAIGNRVWSYANSELPDQSKINFFRPDAAKNGPNKQGEYPPNPLGIYDMSGNICEYIEGVHKTPFGDVVIAKGGSWGTCRDGASPHFFFPVSPMLRNDRIGFRVVSDDI